jgi:hypothetical protein
VHERSHLQVQLQCNKGHIYRCSKLACIGEVKFIFICLIRGALKVAPIKLKVVSVSLTTGVSRGVVKVSSTSAMKLTSICIIKVAVKLEVKLMGKVAVNFRQIS